MHVVRWLLLFWEYFVDLLEIDIAPAHSCRRWGQRRNIDHSRGAFQAILSSLDKFRHDQASEEEMSDMVHLETIFAEFALWEVHDGGVVQQDIDFGNSIPGKQSRSGVANSILARQIEFQCSLVHKREFIFKHIDAFMDSGSIATGYDEMRGRLRSLLRPSAWDKE